MARPRNNLGVGGAVSAQFGQGRASDVMEGAAFDASTITEFAENAREDAAVSVRFAGVFADYNVCGGSAVRSSGAVSRKPAKRWMAETIWR